jgi:hypothetical protein
VETKNANLTTWLYRDSEECFTKAIFFGLEKDLFIFDLILFVFVDYFGQNFVLASLVLYFVDMVINKINCL